VHIGFRLIDALLLRPLPFSHPERLYSVAFAPTNSDATEAFSMVLVGAIAGIALGMASVRTIESLLYEVKGTDVRMLVIPSLAILAASLLAAIPAVIRAVRIDPVTMLRAD
jgi:ABC-type antimicrobial peptide transport system permease subunit